MNKNKISRALVVIAIALLFAPAIKAQMQPAKRIAPKVIKGMTVNAPVETVWKYISSPRALYQSIPEVKDLKCPAIARDAKLSFSIPNDANRQQEVSVLDKNEQLIAYYITRSDYYDQPWVIRLIVGADEDDSYLQFEGIFGIRDKAKEKEMIKLVEAEWFLMKKAIEKKFE